MHILVVYQALSDSPAELREVHAKLEAAGLNPPPIQTSAENRSLMVLAKEAFPKDLMRWMTDFALTEWVVLQNDEANEPKILDDFGALARSI